ncbi:hypothetical protein OVY01_14950 [Robbsia sp. Bb-Pol-6]|uniref:Uncharacterized protein n=1 Tax=Robbsia betulipollinis TaxID=2981849 RepID=A0ABT3ZPL7_9BURK|nr:hypothetical protein [Robbsia betulipollinis]MCY0388489.1 hypothetical protein [Robbsia betulipollinis]
MNMRGVPMAIAIFSSTAGIGSVGFDRLIDTVSAVPSLDGRPKKQLTNSVRKKLRL